VVWDGLAAQGVTTTADRDALVVYCCAVADFNRAQQVLDETGAVIRTEKGGVVRSPFTLVKATNASIIRTMARELGLTTRAEPEVEEPDQPKRGYRNGVGVERTISALRSGGKLEDADAATTALTRHLARALDQVDPVRFPAQTASLARVQLAAIRALRGLNEEEASGGDIGELLAALSAPVVDPTQP
jgi:P27 family predicted phage terminase small subunit